MYFPVARYFRFWAKIKLRRWNPRIVLLTGSSGKTTLLHLLEAQIGNHAHYSHRANSALGIPFDILGFPPRTNSKSEWIKLVLFSPFLALTAPPPQHIYIVEADSDRPGEAKFVAQLLQPEVVVWLSSDLSHSASFDQVVKGGKFKSIEQAIASEFGIFLQAATKLQVINNDNPLIAASIAASSPQMLDCLSGTSIKKYMIGANSTKFDIEGGSYALPALIPQEAGLAIMACLTVCHHLDIAIDPSFKHFVPPPGRSSLLKGIKHTTLIDSSYNSTPDAVRAMLGLFRDYPGSSKWVVMGDMVEQGLSEAKTHQDLADEIAKIKLKRIILMGPRVSRYTAPRLRKLLGPNAPIDVFTEPRPALDFISSNLQGDEVILFKGARFLEGVIEHLLADPQDASKLCRREAVWQRRREQWGV